MHHVLRNLDLIHILVITWQRALFIIYQIKPGGEWGALTPFLIHFLNCWTLQNYTLGPSSKVSSFIFQNFRPPSLPGFSSCAYTGNLSSCILHPVFCILYPVSCILYPTALYRFMVYRSVLDKHPLG